MSKTTKIILSVIGVLLLACVVGVSVLARYGKKTFNEFAQETRRQTVEARAWAQGHAQGECVDEGLARVQRCSGFQCQVGVQTFTTACLDVAAPTPGLCDGVPHPQDYMSSSLWRNGRCGAQSQAAATRCHNLLSALQNHCAAHRAATVDAAVAATDAAVPADAP
jgi:hypothetical protein